MKKVLSVLLCTVLCISMLSVSAPVFAKSVAGAKKTTLIVELEGETALEALNEGLSLKKALRPIDAERKNAVQAIESVAKNAEVTYTYTHVLNGVALEATVGDIEKIERIDGVRAVYDVGGVKAQVETAAEGALISSGSMIGVDKLHEAGIDGTGTAIAVIDGGLQWDHEVMTLSDPSTAKIGKSDVAKVLSSNTMNFTGVSADDMYKSAKVPVAYDYGGNDTDPTDWDDGGYPDHGTHVSGIAAGNGSKLVGVAPEAQILIFKIDVTDDERFLATLLAAIDDAAKFDIASMNMSVGMTFEMRDNPAHELLGKAIENARNSGISVCTSAGNSGIFTDSVLNPDYSTNGIPNSFADSTSVASVDNVNLSQSVRYGIEYLQYGDGKQANVLAYSTLSFPEGEYVPVGKNGPESDTAGKVVLLYDPNVSILSYLHDAEIKGIILSESVLYANEAVLYGESAKILLVGDVDAYKMMHNSNKTFSVTYTEYYTQPADILQSSSYTSYGVSEDLELTVDIAAPGGIIYSSITGDDYDIYDGTSMASPHIAGSAALLEQALQKANPDVSGREKADLKESLMCSTADPVLLEDVPMSPRVVGAGLVNLAEAVSTNAVLVGANERTAINIGDEIDDTIKLSFTVKNISKTDQVRYDTLDFDVITDDYVEDRIFNETTGTYSMQSRITGQSVALDYTVLQSDMPRSIVLDPGESKTVTVTLQLDAEQLAANAEVFTNGFFVEGYVYLTDSMTDETPLNIPFMGFRGEWDAIPAVEYGDFYESFWGMLYYVGEGFSVQRNLKELTFVLKDAAGNVVAVYSENYVTKGSFYDKDIIPDLFSDVDIEDGDYYLEVYALADIPGAEAQKIDNDLDITIDRTAPTILSVSYKNTADGSEIRIVCDSGDLDYAELEGACFCDRDFYDIYPFDYGYDYVDEDGNYVYVVHETEKLHRAPVVTVVDKSGYEDQYGRYSLFMIVWQFLKSIPERVIMWLRNRFGLGYLY